MLGFPFVGEQGRKVARRSYNFEINMSIRYRCLRWQFLLKEILVVVGES